MAQRISRFSIVQTAKVLGVMYTVMGFLFVPFFLLAANLSPEGVGFGTVFILALPMIYGLFGFVIVALSCALYNLIAGWVGGIEVELGPS